MRCIICGQGTEGKSYYCRQCKKDTSTSVWKKEVVMFNTLDNMFFPHDTIRNGYYSWLISPKNLPMQLDWFCPALNLAFE